MKTALDAPAGAMRRPLIEHHSVLGHRLRIARWPGDGRTGRPLLFFTGIGANIELIAPFLEQLEGRDIVTFDVPGIGGSDAPDRPYRFSTLVAIADRLLHDLGYAGEIDVMGVSWGGMLAQEFAYRKRRRVAHLVLAATAAGMPMIPGRLSTLVKLASAARYTDGAGIPRDLQSFYGGSDRNLETYTGRMRPPSHRGYLYQLLALAGWTGLRKLGLVRARTLILMGDEDKLVPAANGRILQFLIGNARLEILPDAGHLFVLSHLETVVTMVEEFLGDRTVAKSSQPAGLLRVCQA